METTLSPDVIETYRDRLVELLGSAVEKTDKIEEGLLAPSGDPDGQTEDEGLEEQAFERDYEVLAAQDQIGYQVRDALQRIEDGTFGVCEACDRPIESARLDEVPYTSLCIECARRREATQAT
jgi:DnaK suppressor protein